MGWRSMHPSLHHDHHHPRRVPLSREGYNIDGVPLEILTNFKYLGVKVDHHLSWRPHVESIAARGRRLVYYLSRIFRPAPVHVKRLLYLQAVRPILEYASAGWDPHVLWLERELEAVQRLAARAITCICSSRECVTALLDDLDIRLLAEHRTEGRLQLLYKIVNGSTSTILPPDNT
jgi:hypothetical protein